jgi:magnesium chelatase family protein
VTLHLYVNHVDALSEAHLGALDGPDITCNTDNHSAQIRKYCVLDEACQSLMKTAMRQLRLTARAYHQVLKFR